jgi:hypothetical protein
VGVHGLPVPGRASRARSALRRPRRGVPRSPPPPAGDPPSPPCSLRAARGPPRRSPRQLRDPARSRAALTSVAGVKSPPHGPCGS